MLPYRADVEDLIRFVQARARGREFSQVASLFSKKTYDGLVATAQALGLVDEECTDLTDRGRELALASGQGRADLLLKLIRAYEPYDLLLEASLHQNSDATELEWVETWWGSNGYGSSENNRVEGSSTFARLVEGAELGTYLQGRRGHPSRIEWVPGALKRFLGQGNDVQAESGEAGLDDAEAKDAGQREGGRPPHGEGANGAGSPLGVGRDEDYLELNLPLAPGKVVYVRVPAEITAPEKDRLITILKHLIQPLPASPHEGDAKAGLEGSEEQPDSI